MQKHTNIQFWFHMYMKRAGNQANKLMYNLQKSIQCSQLVWYLPLCNSYIQFRCLGWLFISQYCLRLVIIMRTHPHEENNRIIDTFSALRGVGTRWGCDVVGGEAKVVFLTGRDIQRYFIWLGGRSNFLVQYRGG